MVLNTKIDKYGVRHRLMQQASSETEDNFDWVFIPGGPGADSIYFIELTKYLELPGNIWFLDFPGNGTNDTSIDYNFDIWLDIFEDVMLSFKNPILIGHSCGGCFALLSPKMEKILAGFVMFCVPPKLWLSHAVQYAKEQQLPDISIPMSTFINNPTQENFDNALLACSDYYFAPTHLEIGRKMLSNIPFRFRPAVWWQKKVVDINYNSKWIPQKVPTLIITGEYDAMVPDNLVNETFSISTLQSNIIRETIKGAGHFPWIEQPKHITEIFSKFKKKLRIPQK